MRAAQGDGRPPHGGCAVDWDGVHLLADAPAVGPADAGFTIWASKPGRSNPALRRSASPNHRHRDASFGFPQSDKFPIPQKETTRMLSSLTRNWWIAVLRGVLAIV